MEELRYAVDSPGHLTYQDVMRVNPPAVTTPFDNANREFVFGQVWARPGLPRRERRLITLTCIGAADSAQHIDDHVVAALRSGDMTIDELLEFVLHFAVHCGFSKASYVESAVRRQWSMIQRECEEEVSKPTPQGNVALGPDNAELRVAGGAAEFENVNLISAPGPDTPYTHAGVLNYVFGHVWQRPGLARRDRRIVTITAVAAGGCSVPMKAQVWSALKSGDISESEMNELVLHFSVYAGFNKGEALRAVVEEAVTETAATTESSIP